MIVKSVRDIFETDPFIQCPFDSSELKVVESHDGVSVGDHVTFLMEKGPEACTIKHIGKKAKYCNGDYFTALLVQRADGREALRTTKEILPGDPI